MKKLSTEVNEFFEFFNNGDCQQENPGFDGKGLNPEMICPECKGPIEDNFEDDIREFECPHCQALIEIVYDNDDDEYLEADIEVRMFHQNETYMYDGKKVKYLGLRKENPRIKVNSEIGDKLTDYPALLFKWLEGDGSISSQGIKGHVIALGKREAKKNVRNVRENEWFSEGLTSIEEAIKAPRKQLRSVKRKKAKSRRRAHRGTNWNTLKPKKGFKRVKIGNKYIRQRMSASEKMTRRKVGKKVGSKSGILKR